jgi:hypothetical protein
MRNTEASLIGRDHPSFGVGHAWFMFSVTDRRTGGITRILLVEARNAWAVQAVERIAYDGKASPNCDLLAVHRECDIGVRSDLVEVVRYVDFMLDVVHPDRLLRDALVTTAFQRSLTPEDARYARRKMAAQPIPSVRTSVAPAPAPAVPAFGPDSAAYQDAVAVLTDLGYKQGQARKALDGVGPDAADMPLEELVKSALQLCRAS